MAQVFESLGRLDDEDLPTLEVRAYVKIMYIFVHHKILSSHISSRLNFHRSPVRVFRNNAYLNYYTCKIADTPHQT